MTTSSNAEAMAAMQRQQGPILEVKDLQVDFTTDSNRAVHAVRDSSVSVYPGQWVALGGASGSGQSTAAMAVLGRLAGTGHVVGGPSSSRARRSPDSAASSTNSCWARRWGWCLRTR